MGHLMTGTGIQCTKRHISQKGNVGGIYHGENMKDIEIIDITIATFVW